MTPKPKYEEGPRDNDSRRKKEMKTNKGEGVFQRMINNVRCRCYRSFRWTCVWCAAGAGSEHAAHYEPTKFLHILKYQFKLITRTHCCGAHRGVQKYC